MARALSITEGDAVIHWRRLRRADGVPMCIEDAYLNEVLLPGFLQTGMPDEPLLAAGRPRAAADLGGGPVTADLANAVEADLLEIKVDDPVLRHSRRGLVGDVVVEVSRSVYAGRRFTWWSPLTVAP